MIDDHGDKNGNVNDDDNDDFLLSFSHLAPQKSKAVSNLANLQSLSLLLFFDCCYDHPVVNL